MGQDGQNVDKIHKGDDMQYGNSVEEFNFDDGSLVCITTDNKVVIHDRVPIRDGGDKAWCCVFGGFPSYQEARNFVLFADFEELNSNIFLETTHAHYELTHNCYKEEMLSGQAPVDNLMPKFRS